MTLRFPYRIILYYMDPEALIQKGYAVPETYFDFSYIRVSSDLKEAPRGTVFIGKDTVYGYPHVGRILTLKQGLVQHFSESFSAEEKIDGYNVRIFLMDEVPVAMTRGGYICPFTTDRLKDLIDTRIFSKYPDLVIYGEVAGPENPYNSESPPFIKEDIQFFIFDLSYKNDPSFFSTEDKYRFLNQEGLPSVRAFGTFSPEKIKDLKEILLELNQNGHEGIVLKENSKRNHRAKFVTAVSSINDIKVTSLFFEDLSPDYFSNRIAQIGLFYREMEIDVSDDIRRMLGSAFLDGQKQAYEMYKKSKHVSCTYRCRFHNKNAAYRMMERLKIQHPHGGVLKKSLKESEGWWILEFERIFQKTTGLFGYFIGGGLVFD